MVFNSPEFACYFAIIFASFWLLRILAPGMRILQNILLLAGSMFFYYQFHYSFVYYLGSLIVVAYGSAILIEWTENEVLRKVYQYLSLFLLCIGLVYLKYSALLTGNIKGLEQWQVQALHLLVPVGISFYTFSSIGYVLDVYKGKISAEKNPITLAAYISFFPYLLIGPIPAAKTILPQFNKKATLNAKDIEQAIGEILWGLFKKIVVADNISLGVSYCFTRQHELGGSTLLIGVALFYLYLYAEFSGYSEMAKGFARLLGVDIVRNFNAPFTAKSVSEFWRRWHISLTNWFYEYVFNPIVITFRGLGNASIAIALVFTFGLSGLWHGADWKFAVWGLLHAFAMIYENYTADIREKVFKKMPSFIGTFIGVFFTLGYALLAETFFRADSIKEGLEINQKILSGSLFTVPVAFVSKYLRWAVPMLIIELIQKKGAYAFDLEQWGLSRLLKKAIKKDNTVVIVNLLIKLILYVVLCYCTWLFYKRMNMAEYYYFKF